MKKDSMKLSSQKYVFDLGIGRRGGIYSIKIWHLPHLDARDVSTMQFF